MGTGWHARRDVAVRGRLPRPHAEHPRLHHLRRGLGARALGRMGHRGCGGCPRVGRRPRRAGPCRPEAAGGDGALVRRLPDPMARRRHGSIRGRVGRERRGQPGQHLGELLLRGPLQPPGRPRRPADRAWDARAVAVVATAQRRADQDAAAHAPGGGGPDLPAGATTSSCSRRSRSSAGRSSSSSTPRSTTR